MLTNGVTPGGTLPALRGSGITPGTGAQKVVIVNGSPEILDLIETALDAGRYDIVFVESTEHAYSQIKRVLPNLVILCVRVEDMDGFQVLSMLKLDEETRGIPVLTYTNEHEGQDADEEIPELSDGEMFTLKPAIRMN
jgi:PleD family two-component response regulator